MAMRGVLVRQIAYLTVLVLTVLMAGCGGGSSNPGVIAGSPVVQATESITQVLAKTGPIIGIYVGDTAQLDGSKSYLATLTPQFSTTKTGLTYDWSFSHKPDSSTAVLQNANTVNPSFVADKEGTYIVQLTVSGQGVTSQRAIETIVAAPVSRLNHLTGPFIHEGLSSNCVLCHTGVVDLPSGKKDIGKSPNHVATLNACQACHTPLGFANIPVVDHKEVLGRCSECHDGVKAIGKSQFHQPTDAECSDCHTTDAFLELQPDGSFDHSNISRSCRGCHNGAIARGMPTTTADTPAGTHPVTTAECGYCHTTQAFSTPYPDHTGPLVVGHQCTECHGNGTLAKPLPADHPDMGVDCQVCHSIVSFSMGGVFNHASVDPTIVRCDTCHNGTNTSTSTIKAIGTVDDPTPPHPTINGSDCGVCHSAPGNPRDPNYLGFAASAFNHTGVSNGCQNCHGNLNAVAPNLTATGKPATTVAYEHMPTIPDNRGTSNDEDCGHCHSPGSFTTGFFDHTDHTNLPTPGAPITTGCAACHNNVISVGKLPNHITTTPDNEPCENCHNSTTDFTDATFSHVGITGNCVQCHDGNISTGMTQNHIPTTQDCAFCHTTTTIGVSAAPFKDTPNFAHTGISNVSGCESCHSGNADYAAVGAIGKNASHIPASNDCFVCHKDTNTNGFKSSATFMGTRHPSFANGCEGCHTGKFLPTVNSSNQNIVKASTHVPTDQDCYYCHVKTAFKPAILPLPHTGITGNCASCHDGGANNVAAGALGMTANTSQGGSHPNTIADCLYCHTTATFTQHTVDHSSLAVTTVRCDSCHFDGTTIAGARSKLNDPTPPHPLTTDDCRVCHTAGGSFANAVFDHTKIDLTAQTCASCHNGTIATGIVDDPTPPHPDTLGKDCGACHTAGTSFAGAKYDHTGIVNNCASCHDGTTARGQIPPPNHVPTNEDCSVCHQTTGFVPATFSHAGIVDNCSSCHDAGFATPKPATHIVTIKDCGVCHSIGTTFKGATFDHTGITDGCAACHDGNTAKGMADAVPAHLNTTLDCHFCHTTATFVGGSWVHGPESVGVCDTCHVAGGGATPKSTNHLSTTEQCDSCHSTSQWSPSIFKHPSNGNYPGDHRRDPGCNGCHGNTISKTIPWRYPQYAPYCAACHANRFKSESKHNGGKSGTVDQNKDCSGGGSGCHRVNSSGF